MRRVPKLLRAAVFSALVILIGAYYEWAVRATGTRFEWGQDLRGYYNYLGRALAVGTLHLPIEPAPELLALPNPWDPVANDPYRMHDMVLFGGRYYLYHGVGPALLLFAPWRLLTGHDLPENFAVALFCFFGFVFYAAALLRLLAVSDSMPGPPLLTLLLLGLGLCQSAPYLCSRTTVYEIPIAGGYLCIAAAVFCLTRGITSGSPVPWLAASGMMFGIAISCRPHLGFAGATSLVALLLTRHLRHSEVMVSRRAIAAFVAPFLLCGGMVAAYNYSRFGDAFEFGIRYLLAGESNQQRIHLSGANLITGLYYFLVSPPDFSPVFPWIRLALRYPFNESAYPFPPGYFLEPTAGALLIAPVIMGILVPGKRGGAATFLFWTVSVSSVTVLLFVASTGFTTQRYIVDFLPSAVFAALANVAIQTHRRSRITRLALTAALCLLVVYSVVANLALGITGPYDELLGNKPHSYVRIARWFSPLKQFRPMLNPRVRIAASLRSDALPDGIKLPVVTLGGHALRHVLYVTRDWGNLELTLHSHAPGLAGATASIVADRVDLQFWYDPESRNLSLEADNRLILQRPLNALVLAPSEVVIDTNRHFSIKEVSIR